MKKKKLLYLSQVFPYPPDGGGKIKTLNSLKALAQNFNIYAVFISEKKPNKKDLEFLKEQGIKKIRVFYNHKILDSVKDNYPHLIKNFLKLRPHYVFQYTHKPAFLFINKVIQSFNPDIIHVDHINIAQYLPKKKKQIWILEHHNLEFFLLWTRFIHSHKWSRKIYLIIETILTYIFESETIKKFDHIFTISPQEANRVKKYFSIKNVSAQPLVYPVLKFKKTKYIKKISLNLKNPSLISSKAPYLLFIGSLGWPPNEDAIEWFISKMFPSILNVLPKTQLHIVGKANIELTKRLPKNKQIFLHGYQTQLKPFLKQATIFILPFRMGGGVRIKCLTALSAGLPIVSTPLGIEGLKLKKNQNYLEAKNELVFAKKVVELIKNDKLRKQMSLDQLDYLKKNHSQKENYKWLKKYLEITNYHLAINPIKKTRS